MRIITSLEGVPTPKITTISRQKCESTSSCWPQFLGTLEPCWYCPRIVCKYSIIGRHRAPSKQMWLTSRVNVTVSECCWCHLSTANFLSNFLLTSGCLNMGRRMKVAEKGMKALLGEAQSLRQEMAVCTNNLNKAENEVPPPTCLSTIAVNWSRENQS